MEDTQNFDEEEVIETIQNSDPIELDLDPGELHKLDEETVIEKLENGFVFYTKEKEIGF